MKDLKNGTVKIGGISYPAMGQVVTATERLERVHLNDDGSESEWRSSQRGWIAKPAKTVGWVTGYRHLPSGRVDQVDMSNDDVGAWSEPVWVQESSRPAIMVAQWHNINPVPVPAESCALGGSPRDPRWKDEWREELREYMRTEVKDIPRDSKGRFTKSAS